MPALVEEAGPHARRRFAEFFTAGIRNRGTREAYLRAARRFLDWCEASGLSLDRVTPVAVAAYVERLRTELSDPTVKLHLAAVRTMLDYLVTGGVLPANPAASVRGPRVVVTKGKTPVLSGEDTRRLLDSIDVRSLVGLRDRALIGLMVYSFARVSAALRLDAEDVYVNGRRHWVRLKEKGGRHHEMPLNHRAEAYLLDYVEATNLHVGLGPSARRGVPLFPSADRRGGLTENRLDRHNAWAMVRRRARRAGIQTPVSNHSFRATGITAYMKNGGTLEVAQRMAGHSSASTTSLYDRSGDEVGLDEVERIVL